MATMKICDVCKADDDLPEIRPSTWRVGFKQPHMKLDVCDEHKDVAKGKKPKEFDAYCAKLFGWLDADETCTTCGGVGCGDCVDEDAGKD